MADSELSSREVWDDTELVDSWNDALAEYKKYHSIAAKGGKVSLVAPSGNEGPINGDRPPLATSSNQQPLNEEAADSDSYAPSLGQGSKSDPTVAGAETTAHASSMPQALLANVQDDSMKNLMMSWYYAGYYTGLYEGKQQGYVSAMQQQQQQQEG